MNTQFGWRRRVVALVAAAVLGCAPRLPEVAPAIPAAPVALASSTDRFFASGDARIRYREIGQGNPVILIHGLSRSLNDWVGVGDSLARDNRVIAIDVRGFGKSTRFSTPAQFGREMANDIVRLIDHLGIQRAHLVGHSMGASIAGYLAARYPERVRSASLIAGPFPQDTAAFERDEAGFATEIEQGRGMKGLIRWLFPKWPDSLVNAMDAEAWRTNEPAAVGSAMRSMGKLSVVPASASAIRAPTLIIVGTGDPLLPASRWAASWWPGARLVEVPDADHITILYHPATLAAMRSLMQTSPP
jgi:pimeloyl-ACP methyl ester carboxylesterase